MNYLYLPLWWFMPSILAMPTVIHLLFAFNTLLQLSKQKVATPYKHNDNQKFYLHIKVKDETKVAQKYVRVGYDV